MEIKDMLKTLTDIFCLEIKDEFDERYICELVGIGNHAGWERRDIDGNIQLCQMCKFRGRLNNPNACIGQDNSVCSEYDEINFIL